MFPFLVPLQSCDQIKDTFNGQKKLEYVRASEAHVLLPMFVIVPEAYENDAPLSEKRYPVILLLHGYSGNHTQWSKVADLKALANTHDVIFVCPEGGYDSWYFDSFSDSSDANFETHIMKEVIPHVDTTFRTMGKAGRAITGMSMGGHGALRLISLYPDSFVAAGSMSGILDLRLFPNSWKIKKRLGPITTFPNRWKEMSAISLIPQLAKSNKKIIVDCGEDDFAISVNRNYHQEALKYNVDITYQELPGAHTSTYWESRLPVHINFFKTRIPIVDE